MTDPVEELRRGIDLIIVIGSRKFGNLVDVCAHPWLANRQQDFPAANDINLISQP
jgi:hypothetical protein